MKVTLLNATSDVEGVITQAASTCYDSDPDNRKRVKGVVKAGHLSCLRFATATFKIEGISRACSHQLVRHAHMGYLQESQRYVKQDEPQYVTPPEINTWFRKILFRFVMWVVWFIYGLFLKLGVKPEDARFVLPNACCTKVAVIGNLQAWHDFLYGKAGRLQKAAQWEIKAVAVDVEKELEKLSPVIFGKGRV